ncbi:flp operon protein C [Rodentibacter caecimuris]|uniref:flp operon protein C n=1 Tax=Rodentibacter caecimuris TaxID=1796644 RepID=UPI0022487D72|nr:flp operon protein C [Rodentibacter heylii]MCX2961817.1 flp operon protein C [Rodentibacter heylii]
MNYRMLFIISFLILAVGVGGILFIPSGNEGTNTNSTQSHSTEENQENKIEKLITLAELKRDVVKGTLLQADDYSLNEITVPENSPMAEYDLKEVIKDSSTTLQGYLVNENLQGGSLLSSSTIISPTDSKFLISSINTKQEVAFRININESERYLLDTVKGGDYVSICSQYFSSDDRGSIRERSDLAKIADRVLVLQVRTFNDEEVKNSSSGNTNTFGYISVKVNVEQVAKFYKLYKESKLILLPSEGRDKSSEHRGISIRKLRGQ